jgi:hypothetical protein
MTPTDFPEIVSVVLILWCVAEALVVSPSKIVNLVTRGRFPHQLGLFSWFEFWEL